MTKGEPLAIVTSLRFVARHLLGVGLFCVAAALGRFAQTGYPSLGSTLTQIAFEILVAGSRIALAVVVLGAGSFADGVHMIRRFFRLPKAERDSRFLGLKRQLATRWRSLVVDFAVYLVLAVALNLLIDAAAGTRWMEKGVTSFGADPGRESAQILLFKNLSVIPLTIIFQIHLAARFWLSDRERTAWLK